MLDRPAFPIRLLPSRCVIHNSNRPYTNRKDDGGYSPINLEDETRPFVLDPANPTFNVCENSNAWDEVAHVARRSLLKPLFNGLQAKEPWLFTRDW
ncbi:2'-5'-oligoadenylate synthase-like protein [Varanus komodoensis]|nr:2'-5'-oligoadenylate synthase-like protein [Varanus komodoensis]